MKLSIIIPAYNLEKYIKTTINSLIVQTEKQFEIIIVDDGSTDNTLKVIEEIIDESNLKNCIVIKKINGGVSSARNEGLRTASGKFVLFLDGDDYISEYLVENVYANIYNVETDIICWGYNLVDENALTIKNYFDIYHSKHKYMTGIEALNNIIYNKNMKIWTGSAVYRKAFLMQYNLKYTEGCANGEDQEFTIKSLARTSKVSFINKTLSYYVQRGTSISNSYNIKRFDIINVIKRICYYLDSIGNYELEKISIKIKNEFIIDNYLGNTESCLSCINMENGYKKSNYSVLYDDIEENYPGLNKKMNYNMKNYNGNNIKIWFKVKIFLISPLMYNWVLNFKNKIRKG